jgi:hypothetical protein
LTRHKMIITAITMIRATTLSMVMVLLLDLENRAAQSPTCLPHLPHLPHPPHLPYLPYLPFKTNLISNSLGHHLPVMKSRSCAASYAMPFSTSVVARSDADRSPRKSM